MSHSFNTLRKLKRLLLTQNLRKPIVSTRTLLEKKCWLLKWSVQAEKRELLTAKSQRKALSFCTYKRTDSWKIGSQIKWVRFLTTNTSKLFSSQSINLNQESANLPTSMLPFRMKPGFVTHLTCYFILWLESSMIQLKIRPLKASRNILLKRKFTSTRWWRLTLAVWLPSRRRQL